MKLLLLALLSTGILFTACNKETPEQKMEDKLDDAKNNIKDAADDAKNAVKDEYHDVKDSN